MAPALTAGSWRPHGARHGTCGKITEFMQSFQRRERVLQTNRFRNFQLQFVCIRASVGESILYEFHQVAIGQLGR
jgi:hypothetical protein